MEIINPVVQTIHNNPNGFIIVVFIIMVFFAILEFRNNAEQAEQKDFKPLIISLGILGTFIGIFCGLWNFDTKDISKSVPTLLEGLKLAFVTSILGMLIAIVLSVIENFKKQDPKETPEILKAILNEQKVANKNNTLIFSAITHLTGETSSQLQELNISLKKALHNLSKGATEEIIRALKSVIADFNRNLTEQFGDNFKQLNESVKNMIIWQENYKKAIEQIEKNLQQAVENIGKTADYTKQFTEYYEKISHISSDLQRILKTNENQIKNIEKHLENLRKTGEEMRLITISTNDFSKTIQSSLSEQSAGLNRLSEELTKQLESALGNLNRALTTLTEKFEKDYKSYLEHFKDLLDKLNYKK